MSDEYEVRITSKTVIPKGGHLFDEFATKIQVENEGCGDFLSLNQSTEERSTIKIDKNEWPVIREVIDGMMKELKA